MVKRLIHRAVSVHMLPICVLLLTFSDNLGTRRLVLSSSSQTRNAKPLRDNSDIYIVPVADDKNDRIIFQVSIYICRLNRDELLFTLHSTG